MIRAGPAACASPSSATTARPSSGARRHFQKIVGRARVTPDLYIQHSRAVRLSSQLGTKSLSQGTQVGRALAVRKNVTRGLDMASLAAAPPASQRRPAPVT